MEKKMKNKLETTILTWGAGSTVVMPMVKGARQKITSEYPATLIGKEELARMIVQFRQNLAQLEWVYDNFTIAPDRNPRKRPGDPGDYKLQVSFKPKYPSVQVEVMLEVFGEIEYSYSVVDESKQGFDAHRRGAFTA